MVALTSVDWTPEKLHEYWEVIKNIAITEFGLDFYNPSFEIVTFEDMLQIYSTSMPIVYDHWTYGKSYLELQKQYQSSRMGLAYEVIFNTSPALCYLMETNTSVMQLLTMSHAAVGHSAFFKNNCFFQEMNNAKIILPYLKNARKFIKECESKYGNAAVEKILDCCHSLQLYAIDRMPKKEHTQQKKDKRQQIRSDAAEQSFNKTHDNLKGVEATSVTRTTKFREENILKFIAKHSPSLKQWERDIINTYCYIKQYLYPQMLTKVMNEGFASFWHYELMGRLYDHDHIDAGNMMEFLTNHTAVCCQRDYKRTSQLNPYKLGFEIFSDIKRICMDPTEEDKQWFPELIGQDWLEEIKWAAYNFKDESFILQYLSPAVMRKLGLFTISDDADEEHRTVTEVQDDVGYKKIRKDLSESYSLWGNVPDVYIEGWDAKKSRKLFLVFDIHNDILPKNEETLKVCSYIKKLWNYPIHGKIVINGIVQEEDDLDV